MKKSIILSLLLFVGFALFSKKMNAQTEPQTLAPEEIEYQKRIKQSRIEGIYIPKDMEDALVEINNISDPEGLIKFKNGPEEVVAKKLHFGLGKWMIVNWSLYEGSRLAEYFHQLGIHHPDDMANFLIVSLHRSLNNKDQDIEPRIAAYVKIRNAEHVARQMHADSVAELMRKK